MLPGGCGTAGDLIQEPGPRPLSFTAGLVSCLALIFLEAVPVSEFSSGRVSVPGSHSLLQHFVP